MSNVAETLDPSCLPLQGERLIEASAGTGETFTIAAFYLRLLLELGGSTAFPHPLIVEELLMVTFTETATTELRSRIRNSIRESRIVCLHETIDNLLYKRLPEEIDDKAQAAQWLLLAKWQMDEAAVFTIRGLRQRIFNLNVFESGMLFEWQSIGDEPLLRYQVCVGFWRRHCCPLPHGIAQIVSKTQKRPQVPLRDINRYLQGEAPVIKAPPPDDETLASHHAQIVACVDAVKQQWRDAVGELSVPIKPSDIDRYKFNCSNQAKWIEKASAWAEEETNSYQLPESLEKFSQCFLKDRTKAGGGTPRHPLFEAIDQLSVELLSICDLVITHALAEIRETVVCEEHRRGELGFDDMLSRFGSVLRSENGKALVATIRTRFPVATIDEFQDTGPQQYQTFRRIWHHQPETVLLLVGGPKQIVYASRGADIFTYMRARSEVHAHYTLDINWRSAPEMVSSVNELFSQTDDAFMFRKIPFTPVRFAGKNQALRFIFEGETQSAMRTWLMEDESRGVGNYQNTIAQVYAAQIYD